MQKTMLHAENRFSTRKIVLETTQRQAYVQACQARSAGLKPVCLLSGPRLFRKIKNGSAWKQIQDITVKLYIYI